MLRSAVRTSFSLNHICRTNESINNGGVENNSVSVEDPSTTSGPSAELGWHTIISLLVYSSLPCVRQVCLFVFHLAALSCLLTQGLVPLTIETKQWIEIYKKQRWKAMKQWLYFTDVVCFVVRCQKYCTLPICLTKSEVYAKIRDKQCLYSVNHISSFYTLSKDHKKNSALALIFLWIFAPSKIGTTFRITKRHRGIFLTCLWTSPEMPRSWVCFPENVHAHTVCRLNAQKHLVWQSDPTRIAPLLDLLEGEVSPYVCWDVFVRQQHKRWRADVRVQKGHRGGGAALFVWQICLISRFVVWRRSAQENILLQECHTRCGSN